MIGPEVFIHAVQVFAMSGLPVEDLQALADDGRLVIEVESMPDGSLYSEFADEGRIKCWDGCNGITRRHRAGWCPFNPEHADLDCGCLNSIMDGPEDYDDGPDPYAPDGPDERDYDDFDPDRAADREHRQFAFTAEEPF